MITKMIQDLLNKKVEIQDIILGSVYVGTVVEIEDKWIKIEKTNKKGEVVSTKIISVDSIGSIEIK